MGNFWKVILHTLIGGVATGVAGVATNGSFKTIGAVAAASAATSLLSLFANPPGASTTPAATVSK